MNPNKLFPLIVTDKLRETRDFYRERIGAEIVYDHETYLQIRFGSDPSGPELAFMTTKGAPALGPIPVFPGTGLVISIPTENADTTHAEVKARGLEVLAPPADKPWGWRSFLAQDPNGVVLDFFHVLADSASVDATG